MQCNLCPSTGTQYWWKFGDLHISTTSHPFFFLNQTGSTRVRVMFMGMEILCMLNLFTVSFDLHKEKIWVQDQEYNKFFHMVTKQTLSATPENPKQILNVIYLEILIFLRYCKKLYNVWGSKWNQSKLNFMKGRPKSALYLQVGSKTISASQCAEIGYLGVCIRH